jgi:hypothetical protein
MTCLLRQRDRLAAGRELSRDRGLGTIDGRTILKWRPLDSFACGSCVREHFVAFGGDSCWQVVLRPSEERLVTPLAGWPI